jgi:hypothetical protein
VFCALGGTEPTASALSVLATSTGVNGWYRLVLGPNGRYGDERIRTAGHARWTRDRRMRGSSKPGLNVSRPAAGINPASVDAPYWERDRNAHRADAVEKGDRRGKFLGETHNPHPKIISGTREPSPRAESRTLPDSAVNRFGFLDLALILERSTASALKLMGSAGGQRACTAPRTIHIPSTKLKRKYRCAPTSLKGTGPPRLVLEYLRPHN